MTSETARQLFHLSCGIGAAIVGSLLSQGWIIALHFLVLAIFWVVATSNWQWVDSLEKAMDREERFRGRGAFMATFGLLATAVFFPEQFVPAALVLGISDSLATLLGGGKRIHPNVSATWRGTSAFFVTSGIILFFFSSWWLPIAALLTVLEVSKLGIDDNLSIPIVTGLLLFLQGLV